MLDCPLVQISTDYVFGNGVGRSRGPGARTTRHRRKAFMRERSCEGEQAAARHPKHLIVRTCGLYARPSDQRAANFVRTMLRLGGTKPELRVVADQHCTPTYVPHLARAILVSADKAGARPAAWGTYHVTNAGQTTWRDFAAEIFRQAGMPIAIRPITTAEYGALGGTAVV